MTSRAILTVLAALAVLCIVNSFVSHLTPDLAIYLLDARSFVETLNRFTVSLDSKGFLQTAVLVPGVWLLGANMKAAAATQLLLHLIGALGLYTVVRSYLPRTGALGIALLELTVVYSHLLWGGNGRPEDFAVGYLGVAMVAAVRPSPRWLAAGGAAAAAAVLTKATLVLGPLAALLVAAFFDSGDGDPSDQDRWRIRFRQALPRIGWIALGFTVVVAATILWLALFDSLSEWWYQSFVWPVAFHPLSVPGFGDARAFLTRLVETRLIVLLVPAVVGFWLGWKTGHRRESALGAAIVVMETGRVLLENGQWPYSLAPMVPALLIGASLLDRSVRRREQARLPGLVIPMVCLLPLLAATVAAELEAARYRLVDRLPSPNEDLAAAMREAGYRPAETIFPVSWGTPMFLLLEAPRPYPTLPRYYDFAGPEAQSSTRIHYRDHPPVWVLQRFDPPRPVRAQAGGIDYAYHAVVDTVAQRSRPLEPRIEAGGSLSPILSAGDLYRLVLDTGEYRVWRRLE